MKLPLREFSEVINYLNGSKDAGSSDKRASTRMAVSGKIDVYLMKGEEVARDYSALLRDISLTGAGVLQSVALPQLTIVVLALPRVNKPLFVGAYVKHCRSLADGLIAVGLEYSHILNETASNTIMSNDEQRIKRLRESILW